MNKADTVFILTSAGLVLLMTPGLALFYGGMVRSKNVLGTIMQSLFMISLISIEWVYLGYSMSFGPSIGKKRLPVCATATINYIIVIKL